MRIGFLGGTGLEAKGLALRLAAAGASVALGSRSPARAALAAEACNRILNQSLVDGCENQAMLAASEIVFLTVPFDQVVDAIDEYRSFLHSGHIMVDVTVPLAIRKGQIEYLEQDSGSNSELIALNLPAEVPLVAAFKTIPAHILSDLETALDCDVFVCGDAPDAKNKVIAAASMIPSLRPLDAGPLRTARALERMTVLAAQLNRRYKRRSARFRMIGI